MGGRAVRRDQGCLGRRQSAVTTTVAEVCGDARAHEIARMLSGSESEASLDHARELLASSSLT